MLGGLAQVDDPSLGRCRDTGDGLRAGSGATGARVPSIGSRVMRTSSVRAAAVRCRSSSPTARWVAVTKAALADIKPGSYVGVSGMPQRDGSQKALEVSSPRPCVGWATVTAPGTCSHRAQ